MANSIVQILRRMTGTAGAPPEVGRQEGELFVNFTPTGTPELWAFGGPTGGTAPSNKGWLQLNPSAVVSVTSKTIAGTSSPAADGNAAAAAPGAWPWVVNGGEVPIVTHDGTAYAFTGGAGNWGTTSGGTALTAGMFTALGAAADPPQLIDWSARTETDLGAAYTATGTTFGNGPVLIKWKDGSTYLLTNPSAPGNAASYSAFADSDATMKTVVLDWTALAGAPTTLPAAYAIWNALAPAANLLDPNAITLIRFGAAGDVYVVTNPAAPTNTASYFLLHHPAAAVAFTTTYDVTAAYNPATMEPLNIGDFGIISRAGTIIDNAPGTQWPITDAVPGTTAVNKGDLLIWDGANFHLLPETIDLSAYLPLAGGTMTDTAQVVFPVPAAAGMNTRIEGTDKAKSQINNFNLENCVIDCGAI